MKDIVHISYDKTEFECPNCGNECNDSDNKYLDRCKASKGGWTEIKCTKCNEHFGMTYKAIIEAVGFKLKL